MRIRIVNCMKSVIGSMGFKMERLVVKTNDKDFDDAMRVAMENTLVDCARCFFLWQASFACRSLPGHFCEVGVYKGGTAFLLSNVAPNKTIHLCDTFEGMPDVNQNFDRHKKGDFSDTSLEMVKKLLLNRNNVIYHQGIFPDSADSEMRKASYSFVHVDVDIYASVYNCCDFFYPRMNTAGCIIFDDYGFKSCPGAKKAVDEFFNDKPEKPIRLSTGQCFVIKQ